jgi:hypothetical protein
MATLCATTETAKVESCSLPAPASLKANASSSSISLTWEAVEGAKWYKVARYDVSNSTALPDAYVTEPSYVSTDHDTGTTISFEVSATSCDWSASYGAPTTGAYTTTIIVVDQTVYYAPNTPTGNMPIWPGLSNQIELSLLNADKNAPNVRVTRAKVKYTDSYDFVHYAELLLWSHCSEPTSSAARVQYWNPSAWPSSVTYTENHQGGSPSAPIVSISFFVNAAPFFTLHMPSFVNGVNGDPHLVNVYIKNEMAGPIYIDRAFSNEDNPCYVSSMQGGSEVETPTFAVFSDRADSYDTKDVTTARFEASPNPFNAGFQVLGHLPEAGQLTMQLFDMQGRAVRTLHFPESPAGEHQFHFNTDLLPTGLYLLSCRTASSSWATKVLKQN